MLRVTEWTIDTAISGIPATTPAGESYRAPGTEYSRFGGVAGVRQAALVPGSSTRGGGSLSRSFTRLIGPSKQCQETAATTTDTAL